MAIKFLLLSLICLNSWGKCQFDRPIVSLSGPMTHLWEELDLLKDPNLKAISKFHGVEKEFKGEVLAGGLFLSPQIFHKYKKATIFFDKSREFAYLLKKSKHENFYQIDTRDQDPFEVINLLVVKARQVVKGCRQQLKALEKKFEKIRSSLPKTLKEKGYIFFLGSIEQKMPQMVIANDGFVLYFKRSMGVKSYPSELAYVNWASKIMQELEEYKKIGLAEGKVPGLTLTKLNDNDYNIEFRGVFTPGIRQAYFLREFSKLSLP